MTADLSADAETGITMSLSSLSSVEDEIRDIYSDDGSRSDYGTIGGSSSPIIEVANGLSASQQRRRITASVEKRQARASINTVDSDVDLIDIGNGGGLSEGRGQGGSPQSPGSTRPPHGVVSSHQPIVHFEASVSVRARSPSYDYDVDLLPKEPHTPKMYYDDFHTIDWVRDRNKDLLRHQRLNKNRKLSWKGWAKKFWDAGSGWLIVFLVGVSSGILAGVIDVSAEWMTDLKEGFCPQYGYYNKESCCWFSNQSDVYSPDGKCASWKEWSEIAGVHSDLGSYLFNYSIYVFIALIFAGVAGLYVITLAPYASGSGIPEVKTILSGFIIRSYLGAWTLLVKSVGMVLAVGAGLSLGKEGPLVHVACCAGNLFTRVFPKYFKNEGKKREVLSAAAAAGVSVAFGAPVGGVLFSLEEVSYYFPHKVMWRAFFAAMTAAFTLTLMNPYFSGHLVLFYANYDHQWHLFELVPFLLIGIFGGLYGAFFIWCNVRWTKIRRKYWSKFPYPLIEVLVIALLTALVQYPNPYTRFNASQVIRKLFSQCGPEDTGDLCNYNLTSQSIDSEYHDTQALDGVWRATWQLVLAMCVKGLITIFTFGIKVPAGLFIPSMFVGSCMGRVVGICVEQLVYRYRDSTFIHLFCSKNDTCVTPGLYAMIGAAAALGGVTRMTVSLVVIMFELTGGLTYIVPIMVAVLVSKWVGDALVKDGIYDAHIHLLGYPFLDSKEEFTHDSLACDVMKPGKNDPPLTVIDLSTVTIGSLREVVEETDFFGFPCVMSKDSQLLAGFITKKDVLFLLDEVAIRGEGIEPTSQVFFIDSSRRVSSHLLDSDVPSVNFRGLMDPVCSLLHYFIDFAEYNCPTCHLHDGFLTAASICHVVYAT